MTIAATTPATERAARWQRYLADIENYATVPQPLEMQGRPFSHGDEMGGRTRLVRASEFDDPI